MTECALEQQNYYSGKKKQHTRKNQLVSLPEEADIVDIEVGVPGPTSDINLFRKQQTKFHPKQGFGGDKGYQGGKNITMPHNKKRKQQLNE